MHSLKATRLAQDKTTVACREVAAVDPAARGETRTVWSSEEPTLQQQEASEASAILESTAQQRAPIQEVSGASVAKQTPTSGPNPQQQEAIQITEGPLLIIAGPGSGKTFTLVERIYH